MYTHGSELIGSHLDMGYFQCGVVFLTSALNISDYINIIRLWCWGNIISMINIGSIHNTVLKYYEMSALAPVLKCYLIIGIDLNARSSSPLNISQAGLSGR